MVQTIIGVISLLLLIWFASKIKLMTVQNEEIISLLKRLAKKADPEGEEDI